MAISTYTTPSDIRAALGVSSDELGDTTLALDLYAYNLTAELEDISLTLAADYATVAAITPTRTDAQQRLYEATRLFSTYAIAKQLGTSLPLFAPKDITDGKAALGRFPSSPYKDTLALVETNYERYRNRLVSAYSAYLGSTTTATLPPYMGISSPTSDPVTGT